MLIERLHPFRPPASDEIRDLRRLGGILDAFLDRARAAHDFHRGHPAVLLLVCEQAQRHDGFQVLGKTRPHLRLLLGRKERDQAVDRRSHIIGVDGREHEMAGLRSLERRVDRLKVAHLAHHDHVGILTQRGPQGVWKRGSVGADLALRDDALVVAEDELDRVLDRNDLGFPSPVDLVDHRRQRRRLAHARGACHEHVAALDEGKVM